MTRSRGRRPPSPPVWRRLLGYGLVVGVGGYALSLVTWGAMFPGLDGLFDRILPYTQLLAGVFFVFSAGAYWLRSRATARTEEDEAEARGTRDAVRVAVAAEMKTKKQRIKVRISRSLLNRKIRRVRIRLRPRGQYTEDPAAGLAVKLSSLLGQQLRKDSWDARKAQAVLVPGAPDPGETDSVPDAATEPVERGVQILEPLVKATRTEPVARTSDGQVTEFFLYHPTNLRMASPNNQEEIKRRFELMMPASPNGHGWGADIQPHLDRVRVFERPPIPTHVLHPVLDYRELFGERRRVLPCATGADGVIAGWDISRDTQKPHALLVGQTGGGKTNTINTFAVGAARQGSADSSIDIWGLDPKQIELMGLEGYPGVTHLAFTIERMAQLIDAAYEEMQHRYTLVRERKIHPNQLPPLVLILDEFLILSAMLTYWWKHVRKGKGPCPQLNRVIEMLALSRSAGIYICVGIQRPDASFFNSGARDNLRFRGSLGELSPEGAKMMWNNEHVGVTPHAVRGRGTVSGPDGLPMTAQYWRTPSLDLHPMYRQEMSQEDRDRADALRPAMYTPRSLTADDLWLPDTVDRQRDGGVEAELADVEEVVTAKHLEVGDRVKLEDDSGRMSPAVVEELDYDEDSDIVTLDILWEGGSAEQREVESTEEMWYLGQAVGVHA